MDCTLQVGKADIEARDEDGMTALLRACAKGHVAAIQQLIEHRADVYAVDKLRRSCLFYAAHENQHKASLLTEVPHWVGITSCLFSVLTA